MTICELQGKRVFREKYIWDYPSFADTVKFSSLWTCIVFLFFAIIRFLTNDGTIVENCLLFTSIQRTVDSLRKSKGTGL